MNEAAHNRGEAWGAGFGGSRERAMRAMLHPLWWLALWVLALNDHVFKAMWPGAITGKLSDFAGLIVAPWVLAALLGLTSRRAWLWSHAAVGAVFTAINIWPHAAAAWEWLMSVGPLPWAITVDPTDLVALASLPLGLWVLGAAAEAPRRVPRAAGVALAGLGLLFSLATSPPVEHPERSELEEGWPTQTTTLRHSLANVSSQQIVVRVRALKPTVLFDCSDANGGPRARLARDLFGAVQSFSMPSGSLLDLGNVVQTMSAAQRPCDALLLEANGLPARLVWWMRSDFSIVSTPASPADGYGAEAIALVGVEDNVAWSQGGTKYRLEAAPPAIPELADAACQPAGPEEGIFWSSPLLGTFDIQKLIVASNGCASMNLAERLEFQGGKTPPAIRWSICVPPLAMPFELGHTITIEPIGDTFSHVGLNIDGPGYRLMVVRDTNFDQLPASIVALAEPDAECGFGLEPHCLSSVAPLRVRINQNPVAHAASNHTPIPVGEGQLFIARAQVYNAFDSACEQGNLDVPWFEWALLEDIPISSPEPRETNEEEPAESEHESGESTETSDGGEADEG